jgi:hypothetical protein
VTSPANSTSLSELLQGTFSLTVYQLAPLTREAFIRAGLATGLINAGFPEKEFRSYQALQDYSNTHAGANTWPNCSPWYCANTSCRKVVRCPARRNYAQPCFRALSKPANLISMPALFASSMCFVRMAMTSVGGGWKLAIPACAAASCAEIAVTMMNPTEMKRRRDISLSAFNDTSG